MWGPSIHEALDEAVLCRLSGRDVMPLDMALVLPSQDGQIAVTQQVVVQYELSRNWSQIDAILELIANHLRQLTEERVKLPQTDLS